MSSRCEPTDGPRTPTYRGIALLIVDAMVASRRNEGDIMILRKLFMFAVTSGLAAKAWRAWRRRPARGGRGMAARTVR
jgi:hypothetical protein